MSSCRVVSFASLQQRLHAETGAPAELVYHNNAFTQLVYPHLYMASLLAKRLAARALLSICAIFTDLSRS